MSSRQYSPPRPKTEACLPVRVGCGREVLDQPMTVAQARRWGSRNMPRDLKRAGFDVVVFRSDPEIHGADFLRVSYGKALNPRGTWS